MSYMHMNHMRARLKAEVAPGFRRYSSGLKLSITNALQLLLNEPVYTPYDHNLTNVTFYIELDPGV